MSLDGVVHGLDAGIGQGLNLGVLDQLLGADGSAEATVVTQGVVDNSQVVGNGDGALGADLLTQTAADTADGTATGGNSALGHGVTGDDHVPAGFHGDDQVTGAGGGTSHTANAQIFVDMSNALDDLDGAVLTSLGAGAVAQAAVLAGQGAGAADLGSGQAVLEAFVVGLHLGTLGQVSVLIIGLCAGAADHSHLAGDSLSLDAHNSSHALGTLVAAGGALADGSFTVQDSLSVSATAGKATAAAVCAGEARIQLVQTGVGLNIEDLGCGSQDQTEDQTQTAEQSNSNQNLHRFVLLK